MRFTELAKRNAKEIWRDPVWLGLLIGLPVGMLLIFQAIPDEYYTPTNLALGMALYAFSALTFASSMILARDRDSALLSRLLTAPLRPVDFVVAYSLPFLLIAVIQVMVLFGIGGLSGLELTGKIGIVVIFLLISSVFFIGLGMVLGSLFSSKQVGLLFIPSSLIVGFSGAWFDLALMGGVIESTMNYLPITHTLDATRDVMVRGAGFSEISTDFYWFIGYTAVIAPLGVFLFKRRMVE